MFRISTVLALMIFIVTASNVLVQFPINDWLTWGAFPYPMTFLVTELTNLWYGPRVARHVVYSGFGCSVLLSVAFATPKIALASGSAFLLSQLLDISVFNRMRQASWWKAPLLASVLGTLTDSMIFWNLAFFGESVPSLSWALGDTTMKLLVDAAMLTPFRLAMRNIPATNNGFRLK